MTQVTLSDFAANVYGYIEKLDSEGITLVKNGESIAVIAVAPEKN